MSVVYLLLRGDLDPAERVASVFSLTLTLCLDLGAYLAHVRPTLAKNTAKAAAGLIGRYLGFNPALVAVRSPSETAKHEIVARQGLYFGTYTDRFGWEEKAATVARVYERLPSGEDRTACVLIGNYGEAAAIDFFGEELGLPRAISGHNSYYLWGPRRCTGDVVIALGVPRERLSAVFGNIEKADTARCEYCMPDEDDLPVYVCRDPKIPFREAWPLFKHYD